MSASRRVTAATANKRALEAAIRRAYACGRVDQAIDFAAEQLRAWAAAEPNKTPGEIMLRFGDPGPLWGPWAYDWDHALWSVADIWCGLQGTPQGHPAPQPHPSHYFQLAFVFLAPGGATTSR